MPLVRKIRLYWESVPDVNRYVVYVFRDGQMFDPANFSWENTPGVISKSIMGKTELILPDEWPDFPKKPGNYHLAITSKDDLGNQSDPFLVSGFFKFLAPPPPSEAKIEILPPAIPEPVATAQPIMRQGGDIIQEGLEEVRRNKEAMNTYVGP